MQGATPPRVPPVLTALVSAFLSQLHFGPRAYIHIMPSKGLLVELMCAYQSVNFQSEPRMYTF